jgi:hypothetical protein
MHARRSGGALVLAAAVTACQPVTFEPSVRPPRPKDDGLPASSFSDDDDAGGDSEETVAVTEEGFLPTGETAGEVCGPVDVLFVIDDSISMAAEQENLINSFPGFMAGIEARLVEANDVHVGVVTTDAYVHNEPAACRGLGHLVTSTETEVCGPFAEGAYMTAADDLPAAFDCAARVGIGGSVDERPIDAALAALDPANNAPGGCNEGFARDDALLLLVIITDEDDAPELDPGIDGSTGDPPQWFDALVAARGGVESNIVVLGVTGRPAPNACGAESAEPATRLLELVQSFTYGLAVDVCSADYAPHFDDALAIIELACDGFVPPP